MTRVPHAGDGKATGLRRVGRLIRELHDASAGFEPAPGSRWNVVIPPDRAGVAGNWGGGARGRLLIRNGRREYASNGY